MAETVPHAPRRPRASPRSYSLELTARVPLERVAFRGLSTSEPAFIVSEDGRVAAWTPALEQLTGVSAEVVLGGSCLAALASISPDAPRCAVARCPLAASSRERPFGRLPFVVRTPSGQQPSELVSILLVGNGLLHLVEDARRGDERPAPLACGSDAETARGASPTR
jgi:PAS domain-containing protein